MIPVNISVKSVSLKYDIGLVSDTTLLYLISNESVTNFLRPYFNIMAAHYGDNKTDWKPANTKIAIDEMDAARKIRAQRQEAMKAIKILSAYKALSGDTYQRQAAQLFIVNDVSGRKTYLLEINDIMQAILNSIIRQGSSIDQYFTFSYKTVEDLILDNYYHSKAKGGLEGRMRQLLTSAHQQKISVTMKPHVVTSMLNSGKLISG